MAVPIWIGAGRGRAFSISTAKPNSSHAVADVGVDDDLPLSAQLQPDELAGPPAPAPASGVLPSSVVPPVALVPPPVPAGVPPIPSFDRTRASGSATCRDSRIRPRGGVHTTSCAPGANRFPGADARVDVSCASSTCGAAHPGSAASTCAGRAATGCTSGTARTAGHGRAPAGSATAATSTSVAGRAATGSSNRTTTTAASTTAPPAASAPSRASSSGCFRRADRKFTDDGAGSSATDRVGLQPHVLCRLSGELHPLRAQEAKVGGIRRPGTAGHLSEGHIVRAHVYFVGCDVPRRRTSVPLRQVFQHVDIVVALAEIERH